MDEERKIYAQIQKDKIDTILENDKDWQEFLKLKRHAIDRYGDSDAAKLVYGERETALLAVFKDRQEVLNAREYERWDNYYEWQSQIEDEKPAQSSLESDDNGKSQFEKTAQAYDVNRKNMLGESSDPKAVKERAQPNEPAPTSPDGIEKTAANFEELLKSERTKLQDAQIDRDSINAIDVDKAYNKTITVELNGVREETKQERIDRKMREWDESQNDKTQKRTKSQEM